MKKLFLLAAIAVLLGSKFTLAQNPTDFRNFRWGSSFTEVKANEKSPFVKRDSNDVMVFADQLAGANCDVVYQFNDNDKLISGIYCFTKRYSSPQLYVHDYNKFRSLLSSKYGVPKQDTLIWKANVTPVDKEHHGQAVADGYLTLVSVWHTERSLIKVTLFSSNHQPFLNIQYRSRSLDELENKDDLKKALSKL